MTTTTTEDVIRALRAIGLRASNEAVHALLASATRDRATPLQMLERTCHLERSHRATINLQRRTKAAALGAFKGLDRFDWSHARELDKTLYDRLCELTFIRDGQNVLFRGGTGVGKTTLAKNLCHLALQQGLRARFASLADMLADLLKRESVPAFERRLRAYVKPHLLVIDELGYLPTDIKAADALYQVICKRHEVKSTIITTNLPYRDWAQVFPSATSITPLVDRFAEHCHVMDINAESWRHKTGNITKTTKAKTTPENR